MPLCPLKETAIFAVNCFHWGFRFHSYMCTLKLSDFKTWLCTNPKQSKTLVHEVRCFCCFWPMKLIISLPLPFPDADSYCGVFFPAWKWWPTRHAINFPSESFYLSWLSLKSHRWWVSHHHLFKELSQPGHQLPTHATQHTGATQP